MKTSVVLIDNQASVRQMLALLLTSESGYEVTGEARTGLEALKVCSSKRPMLVIVELQLPEMSGVDVVLRLREQMRQVRVLVYSGAQHRELTLAALRARPHGFVHKEDSLATLREALKAVSAGCSYFTPFAGRLLDDSLAAPASGWERLTKRERVVLQMVAEGKTSKEVADRLVISPKTVEHHRANLMQKLGRRDVAGLTRDAVRHGLVSVE
jgi:DNA-binding NarL/FixJ family response regulator